jgi:tetratricopeptide (TPR) repeat protein
MRQRCLSYSGVFVASVFVLVSAVFAQQTAPSLEQSIRQLDQRLKDGDTQGAVSLADSIYQQQSDAATQPPEEGVLIDPVIATQMVQMVRCKVACRIGETFIKHTELEPAKHWGETTLAATSSTNQYTRGARVLLGDVAMAMDRDNEATGWYAGVVDEAGTNPQQIRAYAGLFELALINKNEEALGEWLQHGRQKFENAAELRLKFLRESSRVLKRRNHPLWKEINAEIVDLDPSKSKLHALRELASNARKFNRLAEAETNYMAICSIPLLSAEECVNNHLFLAECQSKQQKDFSATIENLRTKIQNFETSLQREYGTYRIGKFYDAIGQLDMARTNYEALVNSTSTSTWCAAALNQSAKLAEKQGDLPRALQLYLQYPQRFNDNDRHVMQAYASALNVAGALGDTATENQILSFIGSRAPNIQDYNVHLNLAWHYKAKGKSDLSAQFLQSGLNLAQAALTTTTNADARVRIHHRVARRLSDTGSSADGLSYLQAHEQDLLAASSNAKRDKYGSYFFWIRCLWQTRKKAEAIALSNQVLPQLRGDNELEAMFAQNLGYVRSLAGDNAGADEMNLWLDQNYPNHLWSNPGRMEIAEKLFKQGQVQQALEVAEKVIASTPQNSKMWWIRNLFLEANYLRGRCLIASGQTQEGQKLIDDSLRADPSLGIVVRLRPPS